MKVPVDIAVFCRGEAIGNATGELERDRPPPAGDVTREELHFESMVDALATMQAFENDSGLVVEIRDDALRFGLPRYPDHTPIVEGDRIVGFDGSAGVVGRVVHTEAEARALGWEHTGAFLELGDESFFFSVEYLILYPPRRVSALAGEPARTDDGSDPSATR